MFLFVFYVGPRVKFSPWGPFGYSFVVFVRKGTEEVLTAACSYEALKVKLACILQYRFYLKIPFKVKVLLRLFISSRSELVESTKPSHLD